ncbi:hypothetical protein DMY87_08710 [Rhizobium wuzhouense]|uniref:Secreted protein n=1 Tax=Rhizobium wuzhouense TaxID=1986026 RepID=A0ABX5NU34_9HYPH|nr:hypothetical protein DMY87_08710 [Rhizobium wuzhouense]
MAGSARAAKLGAWRLASVTATTMATAGMPDVQRWRGLLSWSRSETDMADPRFCFRIPDETAICGQQKDGNVALSEPHCDFGAKHCLGDAFL